MSPEKLAIFKDQKYICLETFKKSGQGVRTPVWFVISDGIIYVTTMDFSWKVKRLKNITSIRITPSNFKGKPKRDWIAGQAFFGNDLELKLACPFGIKNMVYWQRLLDCLPQKRAKL